MGSVIATGHIPNCDVSRLEATLRDTGVNLADIEIICLDEHARLNLGELPSAALIEVCPLSPKESLLKLLAADGLTLGLSAVWYYSDNSLHFHVISKS